MQTLLTPDQFAARAVGTPWERWRSDWDSCDCFGLILLFHREVLGIDLGGVPNSDLRTGFEVSAGWLECDPRAGATAWMAWRDGAPTHCGVVLPGGLVLHSEGSVDHPGSVRCSRLAAVARVYGDIKFYQHIATC